MKLDGKFKLKSTQEIKDAFGLGLGNEIQQLIDSEVIRLMAKYTPIRTTTLRASANTSTVIGSGKIIQDTPYARYQYYGEVYAPSFPIIKNGIIEGWRSPKGKPKHPTGRAIKYNTSINPNARSKWFEAVKENHMDEIQNKIDTLIKMRRGETE